MRLYLAHPQPELLLNIKYSNMLYISDNIGQISFKACLTQDPCILLKMKYKTSILYVEFHTVVCRVLPELHWFCNKHQQHRQRPLWWLYMFFAVYSCSALIYIVTVWYSWALSWKVPSVRSHLCMPRGTALCAVGWKALQSSLKES